MFIFHDFVVHPADVKDISLETLERAKANIIGNDKEKMELIDEVKSHIDRKVEEDPTKKQLLQDLKLSTRQFAELYVADAEAVFDKFIRVKQRVIYQREYYLSHKGKDVKKRYNKD